MKVVMRMSDLISRKALCEYALNQKDKSITPNDIMRFPPAQQEKRTEEHTETHACDLISRQEAIDAVKWGITYARAINTCTGETKELFKVSNYALNEAVERLKELPSAQPEVLACGEGELSAQSEIIRCKGCKHQVKEWRTDKRLKDKGYMVCGCEVVGDACGYWALLGQDDDYCSYAERRTDERPDREETSD